MSRKGKDKKKPYQFSKSKKKRKAGTKKCTIKCKKKIRYVNFHYNCKIIPSKRKNSHMEFQN